LFLEKWCQHKWRRNIDKKHALLLYEMGCHLKVGVSTLPNWDNKKQKEKALGK